LKKYAEISEPIGVTVTFLAGNLAHNITYSVKLGQYEYRATDIIMLDGIKKYEITYYIAEAAKSISYLPTIQRMIESFEINIGITNGSSLLMYESNSTLGIKIQYPSNWNRIESDDTGVLFLSSSERDSDKFLESLSIKATPSSGMSISELENYAIKICLKLDTKHRNIRLSRINCAGKTMTTRWRQRKCLQ
jgi:hypothetical protein